MTRMLRGRPRAIALLFTWLAACSSTACEAPSGDEERTAPAAAEPPPVDATVPEEVPELDFTKVVLEDRGLPRAKAPSTVLSQAEALEDLAFAKFFLEYGYAALPYLARSKSVDLGAELAKLRDDVRARPSWTVGELFDAMKPIVTDVIEDGHMFFGLLTSDKDRRYVATGARHWSAYVVADAERAKTLDVATCALPPTVKGLADQLVLKIGGTTKQPVFVSRDPLTTVTCGGAALPVAQLAPSGYVPAREFSERAIDDKTYYVRLPSFSPLRPSMAQAFIASADHARTYETVVLDLRANEGGDPSYFIDWLERLGATGTVKFDGLEHVTSFAADVLSNNFYEHVLHAGVEPDGAQDLEERLAVVKANVHRDLAKKDYRRLAPADIDAPLLSYPLSPAGDPFKGDVRILVDSYCASACETAAQIAKQLEGFAVLSETNTMGLVQSGDSVPVALPASSLLLYIPTGVGRQPGTLMSEGIGVTPEIWVEPQAMKALFP